MNAVVGGFLGVVVLSVVAWAVTTYGFDFSAATTFQSGQGTVRL